MTEALYVSAYRAPVSGVSGQCGTSSTASDHRGNRWSPSVHGRTCDSGQRASAMPRRQSGRTSARRSSLRPVRVPADLNVAVGHARHVVILPRGFTLPDKGTTHFATRCGLRFVEYLTSLCHGGTLQSCCPCPPDCCEQSRGVSSFRHGSAIRQGPPGSAIARHRYP